MDSLSIVFSTSGRIDLFEDTIKSLVKHNPDIYSRVGQVWILDDRSKYCDRNLIELLVDKYFPSKGRMLTFNDSRSRWSWVAKFSPLEWIADNSKYVLFIEEDWRSLNAIDLDQDIAYLEQNSDIDQIIYSEHFFLQDEDLKAGQQHPTYWSALDLFRHTYGFTEHEGQMSYKWFTAKTMFSFNPALVRSEVYKRAKIKPMQDWEWEFHTAINAKRVYTKEAKFVHTGEFRSAEGKTWG